MAGLAWLPKSVLDTTEDWSWQNTVSSALGSLKEQGESIMQPIGQQIASAMPAPPPFQMPEVKLPEIRPFELPGAEAWGFGQPSPQTAQPQASEGFTLGPEAQASATVSRKPPAASTGGFSLPDISAWGMGPSRADAAPPSTRTAASSPQGTAAAPTGGWEGKAYAAAVKAGHPNPTEFVEQIRQESGYSEDVITGKRASSAGAQGIAQIMPDVARAAGVNPLDPDAALAYAAGRMAKNYQTYGDSDRALAEYNMGAGNLQKYGPRGLAETKSYLERIQGATKAQPPAAQQAAPTAGEPGGPELARGSVWAPGSSAEPKFGTYTAETLSPNQFTEGQQQGLSAEEALAICGPAAAVAFARSAGRQPTLREAKELAQNLGLWDVGAGMHGPGSQVQLLQKMGIESRMEPGTDWTKVAAQVQAGKPVIVDTPQHYFTVSGYDPQTGQFEFGQSAGVLRASKGRTRFRPDEIAGLGMGAPRATIFLGGR